MIHGSDFKFTLSEQTFQKIFTEPQPLKIIQKYQPYY